MLKCVPVAGIEGEIDLPLFASGRTKVDYRTVFNQDLETTMQRVMKAAADDDANPDVDSTFIEKLAYIMNCAAIGKPRKEMNEDDFYEWLVQFEAAGIVDKTAEIMGIYLANKEITSKLKNAPIPPSVK